MGTVVKLGAVTVRFVYTDSAGPYSLLEWTAPAGTQSPPVHVHHRTDEGFYVLTGRYGFLLDDRRLEVAAGSHLLVPKGSPHTFWNAGGETAACLIVLSPPGFAEYFRELADGLAADSSEDAQCRCGAGCRRSTTSKSWAGRSRPDLVEP